MKLLWPVIKREFAAYFATPLALVFLVIFLFAMGAFTFYLGHFYENGIADLNVFFGYHPWLYLFLMPALAMRLWAEERRSGTMELLLTLPVPLWVTVAGKFLAAWMFAAVALILTFPIWLTVNYLGSPDNGVILASYVGSLLMAGAYLAIGAAISATTSNQVIAFIVSVVVCFLFTLSGAPLVLDAFQAWAPLPLVEAVSSFSFLSHFSAITAGVIDLRDLIYFTALIALFLFANMLILRRRGNLTWLSLALAGLLFIGINIFSYATFTTARLDLTENRQFSVSEGTRAILAKLPEPITLKFYYSRKNATEFATTVAYAKRVRDLLGAYAAIAHGKIILEDIEPEAFTPEEDQAAAAGMTPAPTQTGEVVYFGLAGSNRIDGKETIPYFSADREPYLEYDISSLIYRLAHPEKPVLGIITTLPLTGKPAGPQGQPASEPPAIISALRGSYEIKALPEGFTEIPAGIDLLVIAHPPDMAPLQQQAIDGFARKGGRTLIFVDPMAEMMQASGGQPASDITPLLKDWGVGYAVNRVLLDKNLAQRVATGADPRTPSQAYPLWLRLTTENFAVNDPITANLKTLNVASVGALTALPGAKTKFQPLITSSAQAILQPAETLQGENRDPDRLMALARYGKNRYALAARVTGEGINAVIVADSDMLQDQFWLRMANQMGRPTPQPFADNGGLVLNAVENLTGSGDLIAMRTRANTDRPFTVVRAMEVDAQAKFRETAQALQARLTAAEHELQQASQGGLGGESVSLTTKQQSDITRIRREMAETRAQLRDVQHNLRADIEALGARLAFINMAVMPLLVIGFALVLGMIRRGRRRKRA